MENIDFVEEQRLKGKELGNCMSENTVYYGLELMQFLLSSGCVMFL